MEKKNANFCGVVFLQSCRTCFFQAHQAGHLGQNAVLLLFTIFTRLNVHLSPSGKASFSAKIFFLIVTPGYRYRYVNSRVLTFNVVLWEVRSNVADPDQLDPSVLFPWIRIQQKPLINVYP